MENKLWLDAEELHEEMDKPQDECGVFGIFRKEGMGVVAETYHALYALQHRGQDSCGMCVNTDGVMKKYRESGLVTEVFTRDMLEKIAEGNIALGHCRYAPADMKSRSNAQPLLINHHKGSMSLACNGALTNAAELRDELEAQGAIFHATADTEVIAYIITQERLKCGSIEDAVFSMMSIIQGAYSMVIMSPTKMIACRDPHGFRPLCMGHIGEDIVFASESCALDAVGATFLRDVEPGEVVTADADGLHCDRTHCGTAPRHMCVFEYIYFARPDSVLDGSSVCLARQRAGAFLAEEHPVEADAVIGVPDSGLDAAIGYAHASGIPYAIGLTKNKYVGRTFIAPTQGERETGVSLKLNPVRSIVEGKRIVLIDDSIVRGTTCRHIIELLRSAGAKEIHMRVSAPPFIAPCYYGTDIDSADALIANHHSAEEIAHIIGVDSLGYLSLEHARLLTGKDTGFCTACFGGGYPTKVPKDGEKSRFEKRIHDPSAGC